VVAVPVAPPDPLVVAIPVVPPDRVVVATGFSTVEPVSVGAATELELGEVEVLTGLEADVVPVAAV
jgi:hypothetical protein